MLTIKEMRKAAIENVKMNLGPSISLSLVLGLFLVMLTSIGAAPTAQYALLIVIPFIMMPILFSTQVAHFALQEKIMPSFKLSFRYFMSYFSLRFRGVFSFIRSALVAFIIFIFSMSVFIGISGAITSAIYPGFEDVLYQLNELMLVNNLESIMELYDANHEMMSIYLNIGTLPAFGIALFFFVYFISKNSIQVYTRIKLPLAYSQFNNLIVQRARRTMGRQMNKSYWALNFPLLILLVVGFAGGTLIGSIFTLEPTYLATLGVASAIFLMMFFFPFYFSNMEQIYIANKEMYESMSKKVVDDLSATLQSQLDTLKKNEGIIKPSETIENEDEEEDK